jgi:hypothetical protein
MQDPLPKIIKAKGTGSSDHMVECLPSKHKLLSSNPGTTKERKH